jgi:hypothetical protein
MVVDKNRPTGSAATEMLVEASWRLSLPQEYGREYQARCVREIVEELCQN